MFLNELKEFEKYVESYFILQFEQNGDNFRFKMQINFKNSTRLYVKEIIVGGKKRKYGYQWLDFENKLICRWENAPDWPNITTYPHHKHLKKENNILPSENIEFSTILKEIISMML
jgi:hypothetical protein